MFYITLKVILDRGQIFHEKIDREVTESQSFFSHMKLIFLWDKNNGVFYFLQTCSGITLKPGVI